MHKSCPALIKAAGPEDGLEVGQFKAVVSVFGNRDSYGDIVMPGAFTETLEEWAAKGESIPVYYSHQMSDPAFNIGWVVKAEETETGLEVLGQLDLADDAPPTARYVHRLLKRAGGVRDFSFAYDVLDGSSEKADDGSEYFELRKLKLYEVGPTQVGANPATELLAVKRMADHAEQVARDFKSGRTLSARNEQTLREALEALSACSGSIKNVLSAVAESDDTKTGETFPDPVPSVRQTGPATAQEPPGKGATAQEPSRSRPTDSLARLIDVYSLER